VSIKKATHNVVESDPGEKMKSMLPGKNRIERSGRGYFVASSGNVTDEVIMKYIEEQGKGPPDGDFKINE